MVEHEVAASRALTAGANVDSLILKHDPQENRFYLNANTAKGGN